MAHVNARLTVRGRMLLVRRVRLDGRPVSHVAKELGVSRQCAHRWVARFDAEGWDGLGDRSSRPRSCPTRTPAVVEAQVLAARAEHRHGPAWLADYTGVPERTVTRILRRHRVPVLAVCDPLTGEVIRASKSTAVRYERDTAGDLIHVDVKKIGKIPDGGGWRVHGRGPRPGTKRRIGFDYVHSAVDDHSRLAYSEILPDEKGPTCAEFLTRAAAWFTTVGVPTINEVMTDNAFAYKTCATFIDAVAAIGARQIFIKPHCPWQNGKVERFNRTLQTEWAYRQAFTSNHARTAALDPWLNYYNNQRRHHGIGRNTPISRTVSPT